MSRAIAVDSPAEEVGQESPKFRFSFKMPSWQQIKKAGVRTWAFLWKWFRWPVAIGVCLVAAYFLLPPLLSLIGDVLGFLLQLTIAVIAIPFLCLWAIISHPFGGADLTVSYSYWPLSGGTYDQWDWEAWTLQGTTVYVLGSLTGLLLAYLIVTRVRRIMVSRAQQKQRRIESAQRKADEAEKAKLDARFAEGRTAGISQEQNIIRRAIIHAYRPKMTLPAVPEGMTRVFWIKAYVKGQKILPTSDDRNIHWSDIDGPVPEFGIGAPAYRMIVTRGPDSLAMMTVVFTLNSQATPW